MGEAYKLAQFEVRENRVRQHTQDEDDGERSDNDRHYEPCAFDMSPTAAVGVVKNRGIGCSHARKAKRREGVCWSFAAF